ncbi:MAG: ATP-dependent zinc metalloprotease FtsH [Patescibacteria group bacterium]
MNRKINLVVIFLAILFAYLVIAGLPSQPKVVTLNYTDFLNKVNDGVVTEVIISDNSSIEGKLTDKTKFKTNIPNDPELMPLLKQKGVKITIKGSGGFSIFSLLPLIFMVAIMFFLFKRMNPGNQMKGFNKNATKILNKEDITTTFADVAGIDEVKFELQEIIEFLKCPAKFVKLGAKMPRGVLLTGPSGCGKTLLAKAIAGEAGRKFFTTSGSAFVEMFVGVGAGRVRDLFTEAKANAPCIIFIDELDAIGRRRGAGIGGGHDEREQTLNQILVCMDGFDSSAGVIIVAATNRPDILDPALIRPGRFDRQVVVSMPDIKGREAILKVHVKKVPLSEDVDLTRIAKLTPYFSGADLANLVNEAALLATRQNAEKVFMKHFSEARDKILLGLGRPLNLDDKEKELVAYHEAGHAIVATFTEGADSVEKISIIPRGRALGITLQLPEKERMCPAKSYLMGQLAIMLGGRLAEEMKYGKDEVTIGAGNDLERVTGLAQRMICEFGMGKIDFRTFGEAKGEVFLGKFQEKERNYSEATAKIIDEEIRSLILTAKKNAEKILEAHKTEIDRLVAALLEKETLEAEEINRILTPEQNS